MTSLKTISKNYTNLFIYKLVLCSVLLVPFLFLLQYVSVLTPALKYNEVSTLNVDLIDSKLTHDASFKILISMSVWGQILY